MNKSSKNYTLTAKEIATYIVCPESWRLRFIAKKMNSNSDDKPAKFKKQYGDWLQDFDAARKLTWASRTIIFLMILIIIVYLFSRI